MIRLFFCLSFFLILALRVTAAPSSIDDKKATNQQIRKLAERYKALKKDPTGQQEIVEQALAIGGRVALGLRTTVYGNYATKNTSR